MKTITKYMPLALCSMMAMTSCNDYLDVTSPSEQDATFVFTNKEDATKVLNGVYVKFGEDPYTSRMSNVWMQNTDVEAYGPSAGRPSGGHRSDIWGLQQSEDAGFADVYRAWNNNYEAIDRANQVINGVDASSIGSEAEMQQIKGEAICLKAYRYLMLCNFWGDVPYFDNPAVFGEELDKPREDKNRIYSQVLQQLVDIEPSMKFSDVNTGGIERCNRDFALGLIARIALFRAGYGMGADGNMKRADDYLDVNGDELLAVTYTNLEGNQVTARTSTEYYQLAKNYAQKLIQLKPRQLRASYEDIFHDQEKYTSPTNGEVLYEVAFVETFGGDNGWCIGVTNTNSKSNGNTTNQVGLTPAYFMSFDPDDVRRDVTCAYWSHDNDTIKMCSNSQGLTVGKWDRQLAAKSLGSASSKGTGFNWPLMRYSDVLLMLAEAENELNGPTELAKTQLRTVRARAFAQSSDYSHDVDQYVDSVAAAGKSGFFNAITDERAWEFGGEMLRKFDLVRWNLYGEKLNKALRTMRLWGIASTKDLYQAEDAAVRFPGYEQYMNWPDRLYYSITDAGKTNVKSAIHLYNTNHRVTDDEKMEQGLTRYVNWGSNHIKSVTTYKYQGVEYTACTKTTAGDVVTYELSGSTGKNTVTVNVGDPSGVTRVRTYFESDYLARLYRGFTGGGGTGINAGFGQGNVPYVFPIGLQTLNSSSVLTNDGYGFSTTYTGDDVNVEYGVVETENY